MPKEREIPVIDIDNLAALADETGFPRVSIFMPTHRMGAETRQDPIRFGNLLREAAHRLEGRGLSSQDIDRLLADARTHTDSEATPFWQHRDLGLAAYIAPSGTRYVSAPLELPESVHVGDSFIVRPLLPMFARDGAFHVLAVSQDTVTLYRCSRFGMTPRSDDRLPDSAAYFTDRTDFTNAVGFHPNSRGATSVQVHGLGDSPQDEVQEQIANFARAVAKATQEILATEQTPLVLAADDRLLGMLRQDLHYRHLVPEGVREHPASLSTEALHAKAYALVQERLDADRRETMERFAARKGAGEKTFASRIEEIVPAAVEGRIDALIVGPDAAASGVYAPAENRVIVAPREHENARDLVDFAVVRTLAAGGAVYARPKAADPEFPALAAIFRY